MQTTLVLLLFIGVALGATWTIDFSKPTNITAGTFNNFTAGYFYLSLKLVANSYLSSVSASTAVLNFVSGQHIINELSIVTANVTMTGQGNVTLRVFNNSGFSLTRKVCVTTL